MYVDFHATFSSDFCGFEWIRIIHHRDGESQRCQALARPEELLCFGWESRYEHLLTDTVFSPKFYGVFWPSFPQALQWSLQHCQGCEGHRPPKAPDPWHRKLVIFVDRKDHWTFRASPASCSKISSSARQAAHEFTWFELSMISREIKWCYPEFDPWKNYCTFFQRFQSMESFIAKRSISDHDVWWYLMMPDVCTDGWKDDGNKQRWMLMSGF